MEPSCLAVFKDELTGLLPDDPDAQRLASTSYHFAEFLEEHDIDVPALEGEALLWTHCHQHATGGRQPQRRLLERMGLRVEALSGGCCGLAGSWGFEDGRYDISMRIGEASSLLPRVRTADIATLVVANGFSCRTQVEDVGAGHRPLHEAQVMRLARHGALDGRPRPALPARAGRTLAGGAVALAVAAGLLTAARSVLRRREGRTTPRPRPVGPEPVSAPRTTVGEVLASSARAPEASA
jgi:hypothetical protein